MLQDDSFDGFMPSLHNIQISSSTSMITTEGNVMQGHTVKLSLGDGSEVVFSCSEEVLQRIFFLILKTLS